MACIAKLNVINSQMGRKPAIAAPVAIPAQIIIVLPCLAVWLKSYKM